MSDDCALIAERNNLNKDNIRFVVPHQANIRIIEAVAKRLELPMEQVMVNIEHFGNTSAATIPLAIWENEHLLKKGDNLIMTHSAPDSFTELLTTSGLTTDRTLSENRQKDNIR